MARKALHIIRAELNQIRRLIEDKDHYWTDADIIEKLTVTIYIRQMKIFIPIPDV